MLYTFQHGGSLRTFGFVVPPDWFDHLPLPLFVLLHGENHGGTPQRKGAVEAFIEISRVHELLRNDQSLDPVVSNLQPSERPKFVALFPAGMGRHDALTGGWKSGHMADESDLLDVDDVAFVLACIDRLDSMLRAELFRINGVRAVTVFDGTKRYAAGFSQGGQLCYKLAAELPGFFKAIAAHSALPSGWRYAWQLGSPPTTLAPAPGDPFTSVLFILSDEDKVVPYVASKRDYLVDRAAAYLDPGVTGYERFDELALNVTLQMDAYWADPAQGWVPLKQPAAPGSSVLSASASSFERGAGLIFGFPVTFRDRVRVLTVSPLVAIGPEEDGHEWADRSRYGFDAITAIWNFFQELP